MLGLPTHQAGKPGVVAQFGVGVQRQVVAGHADAVAQQGFDAVFFPAGDGYGFAFPEEAVVDEQQLCALGGGKFDGGQAGGYGGGDFADVFRAFHLQAVGGVVFEQGGLQGVVAPGNDVAEGGHGCSLSVLKGAAL